MSDPTDVIVLGAGTTGLATAKLLADKGVRVALVDPYRIAASQPRASHLDDETMRIMQAVGASDLEPTFMKLTAGKYAFYNAHEQLVRYMPWRPDPTEQGWYSDYQFFQPDFENMLRGRLHDAPTAELWLGWRAYDIAQTDGSVSVSVRNERTGEERVITARYLVGSDGARSLARSVSDTEVEDLHGSHRSLILDVYPFVPSETVPDDDAFIKMIPPNAVTVLRIGRGAVRMEWLLNPRDKTEDFEQPERWYDLIRPYYAPGDYRILRGDVYAWNSLLPRKWRDRNVLLAGDAAHQMPPHLGQGMGSGLRDAMNLSWKLAACVHGTADESLLDTYQSERYPHVRVYVEGAVAAANGVEFMTENPGDKGEPPEPMVALMPLPPLGAGLHGRTEGAAGAMSIQPSLLDGRRLDDAVGYSFAVLGDPALLADVSPATEAAWQAVGAAVLTEVPPPLRSWLGEHDADAVIVRPDRYVFGAAASAAELDDLTERLTASLQGRPIGAAADEPASAAAQS